MFYVLRHQATGNFTLERALTLMLPLSGGKLGLFLTLFIILLSFTLNLQVDCSVLMPLLTAQNMTRSVYTCERQTVMPGQYLFCGSSDHGDPFKAVVTASSTGTV